MNRSVRRRQERLAAQRRRRRRRGQGQTLVEFSLVFPLFLLLVSGSIDFGRYQYIQSVMINNSRVAGRLLTLPANQGLDCPAMSAAVTTPGAFSLHYDSNSKTGNAVTGYQTPSPGDGLVYIYPAAATAMTATSCSDPGSGTRPTYGSPSSVTVRITYVFVPWTPGINRLIGNQTITAYTQEPTEY